MNLNKKYRIKSLPKYQKKGSVRFTPEQYKRFKQGALPSYQTKGEILTYQNNPEYFDSNAVLGDDIRYSDLVKKRVYAGTHGYNPTTGAVVKLKNPVYVDPLNRSYNKRKEDRTTEEDEAFKRQHRRNVAFQNLQDFYTGAGLVRGLHATAGVTGPIIAGSRIFKEFATVGGVGNAGARWVLDW